MRIFRQSGGSIDNTESSFSYSVPRRNGSRNALPRPAPLLAFLAAISTVVTGVRVVDILQAVRSLWHGPDLCSA